MAGDWIKVEENMPDKPEVCRIAARLGIEGDAVAEVYELLFGNKIPEVRPGVQ